MQKFSVEIVRKKLVIEAANKEDAAKKGRNLAQVMVCLAKEYQCSFCNKECESEPAKDWHERNCKENPEKQKEILYRTIVTDLQNKLKRRFKDMKFQRFCPFSSDLDNHPMNLYTKKMYDLGHKELYYNTEFFCCFSFNGRKFTTCANSGDILFTSGFLKIKGGDEFHISDPRYVEKIGEWIAIKKKKAEAIRKGKETLCRKARKKKNAKIQR